MADVEVLAEYALKIAMGEEDRAAAAFSHQRVLFAVVRCVAGYQRIFSGSADTGLPRQPVYPAPAGANDAIL
jgi:hypothetical protein